MSEYFREIKPTFWLTVVRKNGTLEFYSLVDLIVKLSFETSSIHLGHRLLVNLMPDESPSPHQSVDCNIMEVGIFGLGHLHRRPILIMRTSSFGIILYEAIAAYEGLQKDQLKIRLRKLNHSLLLKETRTL